MDNTALQPVLDALLEEHGVNSSALSWQQDTIFYYNDASVTGIEEASAAVRLSDYNALLARQGKPGYSGPLPHLQEGSDVTLVASGVEVPQALAAANLLAADGISAEVIDMFTVKPIDETLVCASAGKTGAVVTAENHSVNGGLGSAVAEVLTKHGCGVTQGFVGVNDCHGECGPYKKLLAKYGLDANAIANKVRETLAKK